MCGLVGLEFCVFGSRIVREKWVSKFALGEMGEVAGVFFIVAPNHRELIQIADLPDSKRIQSIIGAAIPLQHAREAFERGIAGGLRGKIVLQVAEEHFSDGDVTRI